ncbi:MAG TPA: FAD:protein FMN transferase [Acidimicrobiales bacterium]|nr:FAD:protein FMN transferase [Acidimicrobiales bacterium]
MRADASFPIMGSTAHLVVVGGDPAELVTRGQARLTDLERRWSRFVDTSEVSWLNRLAGEPVVTSWETRMLVRRALEGVDATGGCYDPTVLGAMHRIGYCRTFASMGAAIADDLEPSSLSTGATDIVVDETSRTVQLPPNVGFDPGGIGKGLAADLVSDELIAHGAHGVCVNIGGDLRVRGLAPSGGDWRIDVTHPDDPDPVATVVIADGAVATSSQLRRRWLDADGHEQHHLIDPMTGVSARTDVVSATVVAKDAWQAEVLTKLAMLGDPRRIAELGAAALWRADRAIHTTSNWARYGAQRSGRGRWVAAIEIGAGS